MGLFSRIKSKQSKLNYRWSVLFKYQDEIRYEMMCDNVTRMLGYYMKYFSKNNPKPPWSILLRCNLNNVKIPLDQKYFPSDEHVSNDLFNKISVADPRYEVISYKEEIFVDTLKNRRLNISNPQLQLSIQERLEAMSKGIEDEVYFFSILDELFV